MFNEILNNQTEKEKTYKTLESDIETFDGEKPEIKIALEPDGYPKALAFYDIDGTLGNFKAMHGEAIKRLYPNSDPEEVVREFYRGISLGTTYRVHDRMIKIYEDGKEDFKDTEAYMKWFADHRAEVDESGPVHDKAADYSMRHSQMSAKIAEEFYQKDPSYFEKTKIAPVFHLAKLYKRLGIPQVVMTANDEPFAKAITKCLGLADTFISMADQKDFTGRGKDGAMEYLIKKLEAKGLPIPKNLIVVGDSLNGDIGSGAKFMDNHEGFKVKGVLVGNEDIEEMKKSVSNNPDLNGMEVEVLNSNLVDKSKSNQPQLARYRKEYETKTSAK